MNCERHEVIIVRDPLSNDNNHCEEEPNEVILPFPFDPVHKCSPYFDNNGRLREELFFHKHDQV